MRIRSRHNGECQSGENQRLHAPLLAISSGVLRCWASLQTFVIKTNLVETGKCRGRLHGATSFAVGWHQNKKKNRTNDRVFSSLEIEATMLPLECLWKISPRAKIVSQNSTPWDAVLNGYPQRCQFLGCPGNSDANCKCPRWYALQSVWLFEGHSCVQRGDTLAVTLTALT